MIGVNTMHVYMIMTTPQRSARAIKRKSRVGIESRKINDLEKKVANAIQNNGVDEFHNDLLGIVTDDHEGNVKRRKDL